MRCGFVDIQQNEHTAIQQGKTAPTPIKDSVQVGKKVTRVECVG